MAWADGNYRYANAPRLIGKEGAELAKRPVGQAVAMFAPGRYPSADMGQFLDRNSAPGAFSINHDSLRDYMVGMFLEPRLFSREFFEPPFSSLGTAPLQGSAASGELGTNTLDLGTIVNLAIAGSCDIDDSEINAEPVFSLEGFGFRDVAGASEKPFSSHQTEINFTLAEGQQVALVLPSDKADLHSPFGSPDRYGIITAEAKDSFIVWLCGVGPENGGDFAIDFESIGNLSDGTNGGLRSEVKLGASSCIGKFVQIELPKNASRNSLSGERCAGLIAPLERCLQDSSLRFSWQ